MRASRYPAFWIWLSTSGSALFRKSCPNCWSGFRPFELHLAAYGGIVQPVAGRSGGDGLPFGLRNPVEFIGPFADGPDACGGDDLVVPNAVDVEFVRLVVFVLEQHVVFHIVGRVFDVRRTVHVAHQVNDVFEVDGYGRVGEAAVVFQVFDGQFQSVDGVARFGFSSSSA